MLKIAVTSVTEKGRANAAVIALLASVSDLPKSSITVVRGETAALKLIAISGHNEGEILRRLHKPGT